MIQGLTGRVGQTKENVPLGLREASILDWYRHSLWTIPWLGLEPICSQGKFAKLGRFGDFFGLFYCYLPRPFRDQKPGHDSQIPNEPLSFSKAAFFVRRAED